MLARFALVSVVLACRGFGADPPPQFSSAVSAPNLAPGAILSIYGGYLGPTPPCLAPANPTQRETANPRNPDPGFVNLSVYPRELCGVQVMLGDLPAEMIYVSPGQINFKVPQDSPEQGTVDLRVVFRGLSSEPASMPAGWGSTTVSLAEPAYAGMPVWLRVNLRYGLGKIGYPSQLGPAGFGCNHVEVRRNGVTLPVLPGSNWMRFSGNYSRPPCGNSLAGSQAPTETKLPLHLLYRFDTPGVYEVRYTLQQSPFAGPNSLIRAQSDWTPIEILPSKPNQRGELLDRVRHADSATPGELLSDLLPAVLGTPDDASFEILAPYLYHQNAAVRRYATNALAYWPESFETSQLMALLHTQGPTSDLVRSLLDRPGFREARGAEVLSASLPYLKSDSPVLFEGALTALQYAPSGDGTSFDVLLDAAERIFPRLDDRLRGQVIGDLAGPTSRPIGDRRVHELLWKLAGEGYSSVVATGLAWFRDASDLPRLTQLMTAKGEQDRVSFLPAELHAAFGNAAVPYLKEALHASSGRFTERNLARELMAAGDPEGFRYALGAIAPGSRDRLDMLQTLRSQFPELKDASESAIAVLLQTRAGN